MRSEDDTGSARPVVSVVIPCFNAERTLERALDSVRRQSARGQPCGPVETILVDDGSTDGTPAILARAAAEGARVIRSGARGGASRARNLGIAAARAPFVAFLDADDEWLPGKLALQLAEIRGRPAMTIVSCRSIGIDTDGTFLPDLYPEGRPATGPAAWRSLLMENFIHTSSVLARRTAVERVGGFDPALATAEDQDLWIKLALDGELGYIDQPLLLAHYQPNSLCEEHPIGRLEYELPMILRHVAAQRHRLPEEEVRAILGNRFTKIGRATYQHLTLRGLGLILRAIRLGHRPAENLVYIVRASPPARLLKRALVPLRPPVRSRPEPEIPFPVPRAEGERPAAPSRRDGL